MNKLLSNVEITPPEARNRGFVVLTLIGTAFLMLPLSSKTGYSQPFIDALFTAASAITTTGLVVVDTGKFYSTFGQLVILLLIQVGGLDYMVFIVLLVTAFGRKLSFKSLYTLKESLGTVKGDAIKYTKLVLAFTFLIEGLGTIGFIPVFINSGVEHSLSVPRSISLLHSRLFPAA